MIDGGAVQMTVPCQEGTIVPPTETIDEIREIQILTEMKLKERTKGLTETHLWKGERFSEVLRLRRGIRIIILRKNPTKKVKSQSTRKIRNKKSRNPAKSIRSIHQAKVAAVTVTAQVQVHHNLETMNYLNKNINIMFVVQITEYFVILFHTFVDK